MQDIVKVKILEIHINYDGTLVWINDETKYLLRVNDVRALVINDDRKEAIAVKQVRERFESGEKLTREQIKILLRVRSEIEHEKPKHCNHIAYSISPNNHPIIANDKFFCKFCGNEVETALVLDGRPGWMHKKNGASIEMVVNK